LLILTLLVIITYSNFLFLWVSEFVPSLRISGVWITKNSKLCPPQTSVAINVLHKAGDFHTLVEIRQQDTARIAIRVITTESHPIRSYFMNNNMSNTIFIRAIIKAIYVTQRTGEWQVIMAVEGYINSKIQKHCDSENDWMKKERKSPFSGCRAI
jgi:hypothetical protein